VNDIQYRCLRFIGVEGGGTPDVHGNDLTSAWSGNELLHCQIIYALLLLLHHHGYVMHTSGK